MNTQVTESASDLQDSTLPVMCVNIEGSRVNRMYGYKEPMASINMRDGIIPMTTDRKISISYKAFGNRVDSVSYEVTAPDTGVVIENAKIGNFREDGEYRTAEIPLAEPILMNREYPIKFIISTPEGDIYYYSRLLQRADLLTEKYVDFVYHFYETCLDKPNAGELNAYLESDPTVTNNSYTTVDIRSSLDQVTWGSLNPQIYHKAIPEIREINQTTCSIVNDYIISAVGKNDRTEYYHVWEFYRMRYFNDRIMLLNFEREAIQIYDGGSGSISATGVFLGVNKKDVQYMSNAESNIVAFVADNSLWEYNEAAEKLSAVFTFHLVSEDSDERYDHNDYGIKIIRVSESGDIDFVVYGYMNRGRHEGHMGVSVCHYSGDGQTVEEKGFISYPMSYEYLKADLERLCYVNSRGTAFLYLNRTVYAVNTDEGGSRQIVENMNPDCFVSSGTNSQIAWMQEMQPSASTRITLMNLETEEEREIRAGADQYLRAVGFINDDFIYGLANIPDIQVLPAGNVLFAMKELKIESFSGELVKDYNPANCWVTNVTITEGLVEMSRVTMTEYGYLPAPTDNIMNNRQVAKSEIGVAVAVTGRQGAVITLQMSDQQRNLSPLVTDFRMTTSSGRSVVDLGIVTNDGYPLYYVYAYGDLQRVMTDPANAIMTADSMVGVVVNNEGQYIYERGNIPEETDLYNEDIPYPILSGSINVNEIQQLFGDGGTAMNLSGCSLDQVLYEVSQGRAVAGLLADGSVSIIVGYDNYNTRRFNYADGSHVYVGINDSRAEFQAAGNVFVSYVKPQQTIKE